MVNRSVSAATVTINESDQILLIRRADNGEWQIPGGILENGEDPPSAAVRETWEETQVQVVTSRCTGVYTNTVRNVIAFVFLASVVKDEMRPTNEAVEVRWVDFGNALSMCSPVFSKRIRDALDENSLTVFRAHNGRAFYS